MALREASPPLLPHSAPQVLTPPCARAPQESRNQVAMRQSPRRLLERHSDMAWPSASRRESHLEEMPNSLLLGEMAIAPKREPPVALEPASQVL